MDRIKNSRAASFVTVGIIYVLAGAAGIVTYRYVSLDWRLALLIADLVSTVVTFVFSVIFANASVYDPYWSVQPPVILIAYAIGHGLTPFGVLLMTAVCFWALRLTANWAYTFKGLDSQDWRYTMLNEKTGRFYPIINFVGIHTVPTLVVWGCILPAVYAVRTGLELTVPGVIFVLLSLGAAVLQGVADIQMHRFRKHRRGGFIRNGLWKYSRHPNYLGEILMWWGIALAVVSTAPEAWYLVFGAVANTVLFFTVSIPMADGRQSRKEGFDEVKRQTRMLLPIPRFSAIKKG